MKIIITAKVHGFLISSFKQLGYEVIYEPEISYEALQSKISDCDGLVVTTRLNIDKELINQAVKLKWIGRLGSGMEMIDIEYAAAKGIKCVSSPEGNRNAVAEHALGMLLSLTNRICQSSFEVKEGKWIREENRGIEISGKTIGIIGFGNTGKAFTKLLAPFNMTVLAFDKYKSEYSEGSVIESNLEQIYKNAEIISFHVPLNEDTLNMANDDFFNKLESKPFIINTSRGKVIELKSLYNALRDGKVSGACLDVLENENLDSYTVSEKELLNMLLQRPDVIITPHIAGYSQEAFLNMSKVLLQKLQIH